jgi:hypothetical protein
MRSCSKSLGVILGLMGAVLSPGSLPAQATPNPEAVAAIRKVGGNVLKISQNDPRLDVILHLAGGEVTDEVLAHVARLEGVAWLNLAGTKITNEGLAQLAELKTLEKLHLERTGIGDAGLAHLRQLENLTYLNIYGTNVTDAGLQHLHGLKKLRRLYVWQTQVTEAGIAELKAAIPELTVIGAVTLQPVEPAKPEEKPAEAK